MTITFAILIALTTGFLEVLKRTLAINSRYLPLFSVLVGIVFSIMANLPDFSFAFVLEGVAIGLMAAGIFDQTKLLKK